MNAYRTKYPNLRDGLGSLEIKLLKLPEKYSGNKKLNKCINKLITISYYNSKGENLVFKDNGFEYDIDLPDNDINNWFEMSKFISTKVEYNNLLDSLSKLEKKYESLS